MSNFSRVMYVVYIDGILIESRGFDKNLANFKFSWYKPKMAFVIAMTFATFSKAKNIRCRICDDVGLICTDKFTGPHVCEPIITFAKSKPSQASHS